MAKKIIMYGNANCKDCVAAKEWLAKEGIRYAYVDVLEDLGRFKKFMNIRDAHLVEFASEIATQHIGIPCFVVDDKDVYVVPKDLSFLKEE